MNILLILVVFVFAFTLGNDRGDQATLRDCATKNEATMKGGGTIQCTVKREAKL